MAGDRETHQGIPYDVPHLRDHDDRRSSVSSASSSSHINDERMKIPYKDEASQSDTLEMQEIALRYHNGHINGKMTMKRDSSFEEGEAEDLLDEEERVGLMMKSKYGGKRPTGSLYCLRCIPDRLAPIAILISVVLAIALLVPILGWLASANRLSALHYKAEHLLEIIIPLHWTLPNQPSKGSHFRKIKHPLPSGVTKLKSFAAPFSMDFVLDEASTQSNSTSLLPVTLDNVLDGTFNAASRDLRWCPEDPDEGVFVQESASGDLILEDVTHLRKDMTGKGQVASGGGKVLYVRGQDVRDPTSGRTINYHKFSISPDMQFVLFFSERKKQWRHSSFSRVWIHNVAAKTTTQIGFNKTDPNIATAQWSTKGLRVSFVEDNNLYVIKDIKRLNEVTKISTTGDKEVFNGVPDWVYEEEVLSDDVAHWWSPDGDKLAYFELDEAAVKTYSFPIYNPTETNGKALLYPQSVDMKYPKPGTPNPIISVWLYDVNTGIKSELTSPPSSKSGAKTVEDIAVDSALRAAGSAVLVTELNWLNANTVMIRETNRVSDAMRYMSFNTHEAKSSSDGKESTIEGVITRRVSTATSGGWISVDQDVVVIDKKDASTAYVDVVSIHKGYRHIAYFESVSQSQPKFLTKGSWEVDKIVHVGNGKVYFTAAYPKPAYRHLLSVDLPKDAASAQPTDSPTPLTDVSKPGFYSASFDSKGTHYVLDNRGPSLPSSKVLSLRDPSFELILEDNSKLANTMSKYVRPQIAYYNITTHDGSPISVVEMRPHDFDGSGHTRYPALIYVYGGPNSQQVQATFRMGSWQTYLACSLGYLVITMDGRGTGFQGREYRDTVTWRLGEMESQDIIEGAQAIRRLPYIAQSKVGVWGWSYGGYLTAKIVEKNSGAFDLAMSVAPVTRWEFYDTIYTERYMKTPHLNKGGYEKSSIHITDGYRKTKYLLCAGTSDDNVHLQNSMHMLDMLQGAKIRDYWFELFPDSSHSIDKRGANRELYDYLTRFLVYNWGAGGKRMLRYKDDKDLSTVL